MDGRPGILIVADNASARMGGEAILPLHYFRRLRARGYRVRMVTHARNRDELTDTLGDAVADVRFIEDGALSRLIWRVFGKLPFFRGDMVVGTLLTMAETGQRARVVREEIAAGGVDVIHRPIPVSPLVPTGLHRFGVPLVVGPLNGAMRLPPGYDHLQGRLGRIVEGVSRSFARMLHWFIPGLRRARVVLAANERTRAALPVPPGVDVRVIPENGVDLGLFRGERPARVPGPFRLVFVGRLVGWKVVEITLDALAQARAAGTDVVLDIVGNGAERPALEARAAELGLGAAVVFHGFRPQAEVAAILGAGDALVLNSVFESGGAVVLEAMAMGLPALVSDWGGPPDYVDPSCGVLVSPVPRESFAARLAQEMMALAADPARARALGAAGRAKVEAEYDWDAKADRIAAILEEAARGG